MFLLPRFYSETIQTSNIHSTRTDFNINCTIGNSKGTVTVLKIGVDKDVKDVPREDDDGRIALVAFEMRSAFPTKWTPTTELALESEGGAEFDDFDLREEPEYCDYDEDNDISVELRVTESVFSEYRAGKKKKKR